jgi:hypothetical protein
MFSLALIHVQSDECAFKFAGVSFGTFSKMWHAVGCRRDAMSGANERFPVSQI